MKKLRSPTFEVHYAPVLTFGSRARENEFRNMKNAPAPRRDAEHPDGKPNLGPRDRARVKAANSVYAAGCRLILLCITLVARWSLEQPSRSWFWVTAVTGCFDARARNFREFSTHACLADRAEKDHHSHRHGGTRRFGMRVHQPAHSSGVLGKGY